MAMTALWAAAARLRTAAMTSIVLLAVVVGVLAQGTTGVHSISGRRYATTMSVAGADWLDRVERDREENTERALRIIRIMEGSTVADIGAGSGYFTTRMARLVGARGKVYANDIQPGMLDIIRRKLDRERIANVELILGDTDNPKLPAASLDLALMVDVYHEFSQPQTMLRHIREALKPDGRLILLEYRAEDPRVPILPEHKMTVAQVRLEVESEGFRLATVNEELPWQHILIFVRN